MRSNFLSKKRASEQITTKIWIQIFIFRSENKTKAIGLEMNIRTDPEKPLDFSWLEEGQPFESVLEKLDVVVISAHEYLYSPSFSRPRLW